MHAESCGVDGPRTIDWLFFLSLQPQQISNGYECIGAADTTTSLLVLNASVRLDLKSGEVPQCTSEADGQTKIYHGEA